MTSWWNAKPRIVSCVVDNESWILPYARTFIEECTARGDECRLYRHYDDVEQGHVAFYLGCMNITPEHVLKRHAQNIVIHESALPHGRGFAPMTWQVLEGKTEIPFSMIEMSQEADQGAIIMQSTLPLKGDELCDELRDKQGRKTVEMCLEYLALETAPQSTPQQGEGTFYKRRRPADSALDIDQSIDAQFNHLRVADNERYPAFFYKDGQKYIVKIYKGETEES